MRLHRLLLTFVMVVATAGCQAQVDYSIDSLRVTNAEWRVDSLDGFVLKRYHFGEGALFCSAQYLCVIEIPKDSPRRLAFVCDTVRTTVSELAERSGAVAAVNGSFFDMQNGNPVCFLRIDGVTVGENTPGREDSINRKYYQYAALTLSDGRPRFVVPDSSRLWENQLPDSNVMTTGPRLLAGGKMVAQRDDRSFVTARHNRTAIGTRKDGTTLLVVADGRFQHQAEGLSLPELERVMLWLGCTEAVNLDGGGSSTMYVHGKPHDGVVNYPSDNRRHDHEGQRPVSNAILIL